MQGDATLQERYDMFMERKEMVEKQIPESAYTNNNGES
ncbi:MAG: hypothetical protein K0R54_3054 [Clostridiaceae bacterium]|jgi:hypothetical protein|nr:hypothetical protein [Clostridiaceae bacterium]